MFILYTLIFFLFFGSGVEVDLDEQAENEAGQNRGHDNEGQVPETKRYSYSKIDILLDKLTNIFERNIRKKNNQSWPEEDDKEQKY